MKSKSLYIFALAAIVLALAGCQKNEINPYYAVSDGMVKFVPSISGNGVMTKAQSVSAETLDIALASEDGTMSIPMTCETVEGIGNCNAEEVVTKGELINEFGPGPQPFDTDESFVVKAWDASTSDNIIPGTPTGAYKAVTYSTSSSLWSTSENYYWNEGETKTFYAYSNLPSSGASIANITAASQTLTYTVPPTASAQTDILMGSCTSDGKSGAPATMTGTASILFSHPLTAVQFKLGTIEGLTSFVVNSISIEGVYASGTAVMTPATAAESDPKDRFTWTPSGTKTVSQTVSTQPTASAPKIGEAFLLIPQSFNTESTAKIVINCTIDGKAANLYHPLTSGNWKAGYTNTYTIGYSAYTYTFELVNESDAIQFFQNTSESATVSVSVNSKKQPDNTDIDWKIKSIKVGTEDAVTINDISFDDINGLSAEVDDDGSIRITAASRTMEYAGSHSYWTGNHDGWSPADWTSKGVIDLSKYNYQNESTNNPMNTANCYIVRHVGTYMLPLVYGNGVVGGTENAQSYYPNANGDVDDGDIRTERGTIVDPRDPSSYIPANYRLVKFHNHLGNEITSAFIENNTTDGLEKSESNEYLSVQSFDVLWQDRAEVITNLELVGDVAAGSYTTSNVRYLKFTVDQNAICQNNALIAVRDGNGNIMWSWHIWTTNDPALLSHSILTTNSHNINSNFFPLYNIGWIDENTYFGNEDAKLVLVQNESDKEVEITVKQLSVLGPSNGTYYEFGRKDPICPTDNPAVGDFTTVALSNVSDCVSLAQTICNPDVYYVTTASESDLYNKKYSNLWTGKRCHVSDVYDRTKTIYDPSPVGYKMPASDAFEFAINHIGVAGRDYSQTAGMFENGWYLYSKPHRQGNLIFFATSGYRTYDTGSITDVGDSGHYRSADLSGVHGGYSLKLSPTFIYDLADDYDYGLGYSVRPVIDDTMPNNPIQ